MEWYLKVLKQHYADFGGRARRKEYWMFVLINIVVAMGLAIGGGVMASATDVGLFATIPALYNLAVLIPGLAVAVRRLHDVGKSGWYMLICFIPLIGGLILLYFMVQDSAAGDNMYGANPKGA
jgi:uncharacterized membrane protein YhaH (DUF805 family)